MSLPGGQQRVLDAMENALEGEPRLRSMFAIFTRLTRDEGAPRTESLPEESGLRRIRLPAALRVMITVPLVLGLLTLIALMVISGSTAQSCQGGRALHEMAVTTAASCQSARVPEGH